jgi:hypothetical protein
MSFDQEAQLLRKAQLVFEVVKARQAIEDQRDSLTHAAAIIDKMGDLSLNDPQYEAKRAAILADHAPGLKMAESYTKQKDAIWESQQKAAETADAATQKTFYARVAHHYGLTPDDLNAVSALPPGTVKYLDSAGNPVTTEASKGKESHLQAQFPVQNDVVTMPLSDFQSVMRLHGEFSAPPPPTKGSRTPANAAAPAQPTIAPTPTPTAIATDSASAFLQSIGVGVPKTAPVTAAAVSGLPDSAEKSLAPKMDEGLPDQSATSLTPTETDEGY